jgi:hypothetical protein
MEIPKKLEECYLVLENIEDLTTWLNNSENSATANAHHSIGQWIRNNWGLWKEEGELYKWFKENEINHPDDMSSIILTSFYRYKKNQDIRLVEQFENIIDFYLNDKEKLLRKRKKKLNKIEDVK